MNIKANFFYKNLLSILSEAIAIIFLTLKGHIIIGWRKKSLKGDIDIVCADGKEMIFVEVKATTAEKQIFELLRQKQLKLLKKRARSVMLDHLLFPEHGRLDIIVVQWKYFFPKVEWIKGLETFPLFPVLRQNI
ncbi:MAG: YraN family protein [Deltaproteobacteria bacterium]|nr:YraN family protein [Deltaproteobacteria bacterium]MCX7952786.1 YraN family protein [Deltaproteobacteria bacterium]